MDVEGKLEGLLRDARAALAALDSADNTVSELVSRIGTLRYTEGTLIGFLEALLLTDPQAAHAAAPRIEGFVGEAVAARILQN
jgi:hypothetical protein